MKQSVLLYAFVSLSLITFSQRQHLSLNNNWLTIATDQTTNSVTLTHMPSTTSSEWKQVNIPHNWDAYEGYRRLVHGNKHGNAWYRKTFTTLQSKKGKRFFLFFEGVGSYATVYLNGKYAGEHAGGRTTFTIDVTGIIKTDGSSNQLAVRAYHPPNIKDMPWVCGGCSDERGFSEGSQPMGIFRPLHLITTNDVRIEPFGVHAWANIKGEAAELFINTTIKNYSTQPRNISLTQQLVDRNGHIIKQASLQKRLSSRDSVELVEFPHLVISKFSKWSPADPYLYKIVSLIRENGKLLDSVTTDFGFRSINWKTPTNQFYINDQPVFINGVAEYEHLLGQSHAFSAEQITSRMKWLRMAGFNAFRDGHQPHNLLYGELCNKYGILWWTQLSAHIWYDSPEFRNNFKKLLREWVIERRNDPSVVLWGLQNESKLPADFAKECTELIRSLDPTTSSQRLVTTCNGGDGTDWDVPQNWTGTYGGNPDTYANDIKKQVLIGEYGAWRTIDLHSEGGFVQNGPLSEDRMTTLMEQKVRLAESAKDSSAGQFFWLLTSHDNPGRVQGGEGLRELDRIGPVNYKGLLTSWEEPLDVFYMFRSNYAPKETQPMVYIVSHTWPNRFTSAGIKDGIIVYSNCDEVELFNDIDNESLGRRAREGKGTHFRWDNVNIQYNVLYAVGYLNGRAVARDTIILQNLPASPGFNKLYSTTLVTTAAQKGYNYIYRMNCGGPDYIDQYNQLWSADSHNPKRKTQNSKLKPGHNNFYGSSSWADDFPELQPFFASQRRTFSPIQGTRDWNLFQTFRYGREKLRFEFPLPDGEYLVELYFIEPWLGIGGGADCRGMRLFDVAINGKTVLKDLDLWLEAGSNTALKKTVAARVTGGGMIISFPQVKAGQAVIAAIAIASKEKSIVPVRTASLISIAENSRFEKSSWLDIGDQQYIDTSIAILSLPPNLFGCEWLRSKKTKNSSQRAFTISEEADIFIGADSSFILSYSSLLKEYENTQSIIETNENGGKKYGVFRKRFSKNAAIKLPNDPGYFIIARRVDQMQPAYDLKPVTAYRAGTMKTSAGFVKERFAERECAVAKSASNSWVEWPIQTGVADIYSITAKYYWPGETPAKGRIQLIDAGNTMMLDLPVEFTFTRSGKWNQFTVNTGTMINAGNYRVRIIVDDGAGLAISGIDIQ